jgi:K+-transporting ATPase ATPase C chain
VLALLAALTGVVYPLVVTALAQWFWPARANGSLIVVNGRTVGSELIGQNFGSHRYFWSRPFCYNAPSLQCRCLIGFELGAQQ